MQNTNPKKKSPRKKKLSLKVETLDQRANLSHGTPCHRDHGGLSAPSGSAQSSWGPSVAYY